jgi:hypothetical protein
MEFNCTRDRPPEALPDSVVIDPHRPRVFPMSVGGAAGRQNRALVGRKFQIQYKLIITQLLSLPLRRECLVNITFLS